MNHSEMSDENDPHFQEVPPLNVTNIQIFEDESYSFVNTRKRGNPKEFKGTNSNLNDFVDTVRDSCMQLRNMNLSPPHKNSGFMKVTSPENNQIKSQFPRRDSRIIISGEITSLVNKKIELNSRNEESPINTNVSKRYSFCLREGKKEKPTIKSNIIVRNSPDYEKIQLLLRRFHEKKNNSNPKTNQSSNVSQNESTENSLELQEELNCQKGLDFNNSNEYIENNFSNVQKEIISDEDNIEINDENLDSINSPLEDSMELFEEMSQIIVRRLEYLKEEKNLFLKLQSLVQKLFKKNNFNPKINLSSNVSQNKSENASKLQEKLHCQKGLNVINRDSSEVNVETENEIVASVSSPPENSLKDKEDIFETILEEVKSIKKIIKQDMKSCERLQSIQELWKKKENLSPKRILPSNVSQNKNPGQPLSTGELLHLPEEKTVSKYAAKNSKLTDQGKANTKNIGNVNVSSVLCRQEIEHVFNMIQDDESTMEMTIKIDFP